MTTPTNTSTIITNVVVSKRCSLSPDADSTDSKTFTVELSITDVTLQDMANSILKSEVIRWQNANRKRYTKLVDKSTVKLTFKRPVADIDPRDAMVSMLANMNDVERIEYLNKMAADAAK